jgi:hypothetical protein
VAGEYVYDFYLRVVKEGYKRTTEFNDPVPRVNKKIAHEAICKENLQENDKIHGNKSVLKLDILCMLL